MYTATWGNVTPDKIAAFKAWALANHDNVASTPTATGESGRVSGHVLFVGWAFDYVYTAAAQAVAVTPENHADAVIAQISGTLGRPEAEA